jgi:hypothetical protein
MVSLSYSTGSVIGGSYAGGLVGSNSGTIVNGYSTSTVTGSSNIGGLVGYNITGTIGFSYSTGCVSGDSYTGGLVGYDAGAIHNAHWNTTSSGTAVACGNRTCSATGLDSAAMLQSASFDSLDFDSVWFQYDGHTPPLLRTFLTPLTVTAKDTTRDSDGVAFAGGAGVSYSTAVTDSLLHGTPAYGGTSQGATDTGHYTITVGGLWSNQRGYMISYKSGTLRIAARGTTALQIRPTHLAISHDLAASIARSFGTLAQGSGTAQIGTGVDATDAQTVDVLLPNAATVQVSIFDNLGTQVISWSRDVSAYDLANLDATGDGRWVLPVSWNGRASNGQAVPAGVYLWKIVVRTEDGQKLETVKKLGVR